jgi:putative tryptophan/tyrosine transport system substrate-binding protein
MFDVGRREFITLLGGAGVAWPLVVRAQQAKVWRVGLLMPTPADAVVGAMTAFRAGLRERGWVEGQNLVIDYRVLHTPGDQNADIAGDLVRSFIDVIVAWTTPATMAARAATSSIPIVMVNVGDPIGTGLVASLARPGGNVTGISNMGSDLNGKVVELLKDVAPGAKRIGVLYNPSNPAVLIQLRETENAIRALRIEYEVAEASAAEDFDRAFARLRSSGVNGVILIPDSSLIEHRERIAALAIDAGLPTLFQRRENVEAGGLLSYGSRFDDAFRQAALYVDRILKGTKPADLPVEQPTKFELVVNLKTAKALGLTINRDFLLRADELIE